MMLTLLSSVVLCIVVLWLFFGALQALIYRLLQPSLLSIDPAQASKCLLVWLALPPAAALLASYVLYSPDLAQWFVAGHCHTSQCQSHGPQSSLAVLPAALLAAWTLYSVVLCLYRQWLPARHLCDQLTMMGVDQGGYITLEDNQPMAFTLGWLKPRIFVSRGLQNACSATEIDCILQHEAAHRERRDNLRLLAGRLLTAPLPQRWTHCALDDLKLCCEQACDSRAANLLSRESVAAALIKVTRLQQRVPPVGSLAFSGNHTRQRILALLDAPQTPLANGKLFAAATVTLLIILALIDPLHRAVELLP
jgi:beta-lactamase regulating signal transducer with metallopeptidase domain